MNECQDLTQLSREQLLQNMDELVVAERRLSVKLLHHLKEIDRRRLWAERAYSSLFEYCTRGLGYSESQAYRRISALRMMKELPEIEHKITEGKLNLSTIAQVQTFFKREEKSEREFSLKQKRELMVEIEKKTQKQVAMELARLSPESSPPDRERPLSNHQLQIQFTADQELQNKINRLRELVSLTGNYAELFHKVCDIALKNLDPGMKERSASSKRLNSAAKPSGLILALNPSENSQRRISTIGPSKSIPTANASRSSKGSIPVANSPGSSKRMFASNSSRKSTRYIPAAVRREVWRRDRGQCTYRDPKTGQECLCRHGVQFDHVIPLAKGGLSTLENLRLYCRAHNQWAAIEEFGVDKIKTYVPSLS